jgi:hypothetical protein
MNLFKLACLIAPAMRRRRSVGLAVEVIEKRLALSPTLPLPPPHSASAAALATEKPIFPSGPCYPNGPCAIQGPAKYPVGPLRSAGVSELPNGPCGN